MNILRPRQIRRLVQWRTRHQQRSLLSYDRIKTRNSSFSESLLKGKRSDGRWGNQESVEIPRGFLPVYVGPHNRRFIVPAVYLSMPDFRVLMERAAEEFGFEQEGGLKIPCEEEDFEEVLFKCLANHKSMTKTRRRKSGSSLFS